MVKVIGFKLQLNVGSLVIKGQTAEEVRAARALLSCTQW